jgi:hypothetical protein
LFFAFIYIIKQIFYLFYALYIYKFIMAKGTGISIMSYLLCYCCSVVMCCIAIIAAVGYTLSTVGSAAAGAAGSAVSVLASDGGAFNI